MNTIDKTPEWLDDWKLGKLELLFKFLEWSDWKDKITENIDSKAFSWIIESALIEIDKQPTSPTFRNVSSAMDYLNNIA